MASARPNANAASSTPPACGITPTFNTMLPQPMKTSHAVPALSTNNRLPNATIPPPVSVYGADGIAWLP
ncbi:protein of unknown function [Paraburkholderia dioscoreae]|uniref:Uncharacterized protein n=1 Tax=Paraburkholderia dioscoreae TaxID=2604047 RepID=A0A5Q4ZIB6_9BURK|nr:protein of unknown function [Paraburkholderia dioscoreae]